MLILVVPPCSAALGEIYTSTHPLCSGRKWDRAEAGKFLRTPAILAIHGKPGIKWEM